MTSVEVDAPTWARRLKRTSPRPPSVFSAVSVTLALLVVAATLVPIAMVVARLFFVDGSFTLQPISHTLSHPGLWHTLLTTLGVVFASAVIATIVGGGLAWLNERTDARMGLLSDLMPMVPFLVPPAAGAMGWVFLWTPSAGYLNVAWDHVLGLVGIHTSGPLFDIYTWYGLVFVFSIYGVAFTYMMIAPALRTLDSNLEEQSRISGAGALRTHLRVTLPAIMPAVVAGILLWVWVALVTVDIPLIIGSRANVHMLATDIVNALNKYPFDRPLGVGLSGIVGIIVVVVWLFQSAVLRAGKHAAVGSKGTRTVPTKLGRWRSPLRILMVAYMVLTTVLPFGALLIVAFTGTWQPHIQWSRFSWRQYADFFSNPYTQDGLRNSMVMALVTATVVVLICAIISLYIRRSGSVVGRLIDAGIKLPSTLGALILVVGVLLTFAGPPFRLAGTLTILFIGFILLCIPNASIASDAAVATVGEELMEASALSGAREGTTFFRVVLPLLIPSLVGAWAIVFVRVLSDVTVSFLLAGIGNPVIGFELIDAQQNKTPADVAAIASVVTVISAVVLFLAVWYGRHASRWASDNGR